MEESTKESTMMIKNKVMVFSLGQMVESMKVVGTMENNTEKASIIHLKEKPKEESGKKEREFDGLVKINENRI